MHRAILTLALAVAAGCSGDASAVRSPDTNAMADDSASQAPRPSGLPAADSGAREVATFGAGCFWCVEAVLEQLDGVLDVTSGYMGGHVERPTYRDVCAGDTGHAEVVQVTFDPSRIAYDELLSWFWRLHDPTTVDRQGADVGPQYRSVIFWHSDAQRTAAQASKAAADRSGAFAAPIVTEIAEAGPFFPAETYHQDYYRENKRQGYCRMVIAPKLDALGLEK